MAAFMWLRALLHNNFWPRDVCDVYTLYVIISRHTRGCSDRPVCWHCYWIGQLDKLVKCSKCQLKENAWTCPWLIHQSQTCLRVFSLVLVVRRSAPFWRLALAPPSSPTVFRSGRRYVKEKKVLQLCHVVICGNCAPKGVFVENKRCLSFMLTNGRLTCPCSEIWNGPFATFPCPCLDLCPSRFHYFSCEEGKVEDWKQCLCTSNVITCCLLCLSIASDSSFSCKRQKKFQPGNQKRKNKKEGWWWLR